MRNAERGASQIPLVICIVLLLVAGFFAYNQYEAASELEGRLSRIKDSAKTTGTLQPDDSEVMRHIGFAVGLGSKLRTRLDEVGVETGSRDEENPDLVVSPTKLRATTQKFLDACDKGAFVVEFPTARYIEDTGSGTIKVQQGQEKVSISYGGTRDLRGAKPDMTAVIDYVVVPGMQRMVNDIKRYRDAYVAAMSAKEAADAAGKAAIAEKDATIKGKSEEFATMEGQKNQKIADLTRERDEALASKQASEDEKNKAVAALTAERNALRSELDKASGAVQVLKARKRAIEADTSPDGTVLSVSDKQDFVVIDIGKVNNNLTAGPNFDVYAIGKGGQEIPKGVIKVARVEAGSSECRVLDVYDRFNPIAPGDRIRSYFYSPKETIHVALVGRFHKMGKSDAARRLQTLGVVVDEKVTTNTTYLIVGDRESENQPIEETPEYKAAEIWGIPHISENELSKFTMY
jgi:hypothetical protein